MERRFTRRETARFEVIDASGRRHPMVEHTTFMSVVEMSGRESPPLPHSVEYSSNGISVNLDEDTGEFDILTSPPLRCRRA